MTNQTEITLSRSGTDAHGRFYILAVNGVEIPARCVPAIARGFLLAAGFHKLAAAQILDDLSNDSGIDAFTFELDEPQS